MYVSVFDFAKISIKPSGYWRSFTDFRNVYDSIFNFYYNFNLLHEKG